MLKIFLFLPLLTVLARNKTLYDRILKPKGLDDGGISQVLALTQHVMKNYMTKCNLLVTLHSSFKFETETVNFDVTTLFRNFSEPFAFTKITKKNKVPKELLELPGSKSRAYILFLKDVAQTTAILGNQPLSKVMVVTRSSSWKIIEFLESSEAKGIANLLVIATSGSSEIIVRRGEKLRLQKFLNIYTHELYTDGFGNSRARLLTSWGKNKLSRNVNLFPQKLTKGFNGRQFEVVASEQPPFVIKKKIAISEDADSSVLWDGSELRLLRLLSQFLNYTIQIKEAVPLTITKGPAEAAAEAVAAGVAEISVAGVYRSSHLSNGISFSIPHTVDCAAFVTRSSTALPRYRAIVGPFHWHVWLTLTLTYFIAILPLTFFEKHSLSYLWQHPWHIETMFWYVFGTFTNCFTFKGDHSWTKSEKNASRMLIGWYWAFSIIVTACYTGSIISFITLYVYPPVINNIEQLLDQNYRIGSLTSGRWGQWFNNSDHPQTKWLLRDIELVHNVSDGLKNVTGSYYLPLLRPYAFLGSRAQLEYIIKTNYTLMDRKVVMYVTRDCFVPFGVSFMYPSNAPYRAKFDEFILRAQQSGLINKLYKQMEWDLHRSAQGKLLQASSGALLRDVIVLDRKLTLDDTQGMFLLLGAGFLIAATVFFFEKSNHHQTQGKSWKLWEYCPRVFTRFNEFVSNDEYPNVMVDGNFLYKKYDSRVLNSRYRNMEPRVFLSEPQLIGHDRPIIRTHSLPELHVHVRTHRLSKSCHEVGRKEPENIPFKSAATSTDNPIFFCSVGSILDTAHCQDVLIHTYLQGRPQTSVF